MTRAETISSRARRWWGWIVGVLLVVGGILLVIALFGDTVAEQAGQPMVASKPVAADTRLRDTRPSFDEAMLFGARDPLLAGTEVALGGLRVTRVLGDRVFYVARLGEAMGRQFVVFTDRVPAGGIEPGIELAELTGTVRAVARADLGSWAVPPEETERIRASDVYLHAERLRIADGS